MLDTPHVQAYLPFRRKGPFLGIVAHQLLGEARGAGASAGVFA
jgi:hypothetical protein